MKFNGNEVEGANKEELIISYILFVVIIAFITFKAWKWENKTDFGKTNLEKTFTNVVAKSDTTFFVITPANIKVIGSYDSAEIIIKKIY